MSLTLICEARAFAIKAHGDQKRLYTGEPYWHHCRDVADLIYDAVDIYEELIAAAWLHDVLEDTRILPVTLQVMFGPQVQAMCLALEKSVDETETLHRLRVTSKSVQTIKVADIINNCSTLRERDPGRADAYFAKKREQLKVMTWADPVLWVKAWSIVGVP